MFFAQMISAVGFSSIFPFLPLYVKSLGAATSLVSIELLTGLVFSLQAFTMMVASPVWGALADRWGRKLMVERAMFGGTLILGLMAFVRSAEELVLLRGLQGLITGTIGAANALVAAAVPRERVGYAMGLLQVGMGLGVGLGPIIGGAVADVLGYRAAFFVTAALLLTAGGVVYFGVEEQFQRAEPPGNAGRGWLGEWRRILSAPGVAMTYAMRFVNQTGRLIFVPVLPLFLLTLLESPDRINSFTGLVIGTASAATAVFAIYFGRLGDRVGHRRIIFASSLACTLAFALQGLATAGWQLLLLQVAAGAALGGIVPGISALLAQYTPRGSEGAVYGLDNSVTSGARTLGPLLGVGIAAWLGYRAVFITAAVLYLIPAFVALWRLPQPGRSEKTP
jgi:DHA1 family multidrug resistance protein-like MFS transporter